MPFTIVILLLGRDPTVAVVSNRRALFLPQGEDRRVFHRSVFEPAHKRAVVDSRPVLEANHLLALA
jgi:hypothetical protein